MPNTLKRPSRKPMKISRPNKALTNCKKQEDLVSKDQAKVGANGDSNSTVEAQVTESPRPSALPDDQLNAELASRSILEPVNTDGDSEEESPPSNKRVRVVLGRRSASTASRDPEDRDDEGTPRKGGDDSDAQSLRSLLSDNYKYVGPRSRLPHRLRPRSTDKDARHAGDDAVDFEFHGDDDDDDEEGSIGSAESGFAYDDPWPEDQPHPEVNLGEEYIPPIKVHNLHLFEPLQYRTIPICIDGIQAFWQSIYEKDLQKEQTVFLRVLDPLSAWDLASELCTTTAARNDEALAELKEHLTDLTNKLEILARWRRWQRPKKVLHDFYLIVYPSLTILVFLAIAALSPSYEQTSAESADACAAIDCIHNLTAAVTRLETRFISCLYPRKSQKVSRHPDAALFTRIKTIARSPLSSVEKSFDVERQRRKEAMAEVDRNAKARRARAAREEAKRLQKKGDDEEEVEVDDDILSTERREKRWKAEDARRQAEQKNDWANANEEERSQMAQRWQREKDARIDEVRQEIWTRLTKILERKSPHMTASARIEYCTADSLVRACGMEREDIEQEMRWLVQSFKENCEENGGELWEWAATLLDEWML